MTAGSKRGLHKLVNIDQNSLSAKKGVAPPALPSGCDDDQSMNHSGHTHPWRGQRSERGWGGASRAAAGSSSGRSVAKKGSSSSSSREGMSAPPSPRRPASGVCRGVAM